MKRETKCEKAHLTSVVSKYTKEIEGIIEKGCNIDLDDIAVELKNIHPYLSTILSKWTPEIIYALYIKEKMSFNNFKRIFNISSRVLSDKLKNLEENGIIERLVTNDNPPRVYYKLTEFGKELALSLVPVLIVIKNKSDSYED
ncbi:winged helix-turn-helix transcriptional regulator [Methanotorris formicicus]|uniref:Transcriptional regulator, HxlR family n=1 Tax=Methanotorris formicicus Mc-S-70 TaxID=647171 RepID=H1L026_9EURY|nr:helix-turn-helix domain-containing protein [Methanotorris formicicus]EHP85246.1 transcriptional regulator, HxlR family [Methanotorris formicicus Mc-S-70]